MRTRKAPLAVIRDVLANSFLFSVGGTSAVVCAELALSLGVGFVAIYLQGSLLAAFFLVVIKTEKVFKLQRKVDRSRRILDQGWLIQASFRGNLQMVQYFVHDKKIGVNEVWGTAGTTDVITPLFAASLGGNLELARWLAERAGADVGWKNGNGRTAQAAAAKAGHTAVASLLRYWSPSNAPFRAALACVRRARRIEEGEAVQDAPVAELMRGLTLKIPEVLVREILEYLYAER